MTETIDHGDLQDNVGTGGTDYNLYKETIDPNEHIVTDILTEEKNRLNAKEAVIQPIYETKKRKDAQKRSTTLRKNAYTYMFLVVLAIVGLVVILFILKNYFPVIPDFVLDWLILFVVAGGIIYLIILAVDIVKRDPMDFEKIDFGILVDIEEVKEDDGETGVDLIMPNVQQECVGADCCDPSSNPYFYDNQCNRCPEGQIWDTSTNACKLSPSVEGFESKKNVKPYTPKPTFTPV